MGSFTCPCARSQWHRVRDERSSLQTYISDLRLGSVRQAAASPRLANWGRNAGRLARVRRMEPVLHAGDRQVRADHRQAERRVLSIESHVAKICVAANVHRIESPYQMHEASAVGAHTWPTVGVVDGLDPVFSAQFGERLELAANPVDGLPVIVAFRIFPVSDFDNRHGGGAAGAVQLICLVGMWIGEIHWSTGHGTHQPLSLPDMGHTSPCPLTARGSASVMLSKLTGCPGRMQTSMPSYPKSIIFSPSCSGDSSAKNFELRIISKLTLIPHLHFVVGDVF